MKARTTVAHSVFGAMVGLVVFAYLLSGGLTQVAAGFIDSETFTIGVLGSVVLSTVVAAIAASTGRHVTRQNLVVLAVAMLVATGFGVGLSMNRMSIHNNNLNRLRPVGNDATVQAHVPWAAEAPDGGPTAMQAISEVSSHDSNVAGEGVVADLEELAQKLVSSISDGSVHYWEAYRTSEKPLNVYKVDFRTSNLALLSAPDASSNRMSFAANVGKRTAWEEAFCTPELRRLMIAHRIDLVVGGLSDAHGRNQFLAVCMSTMQQ